MVSIIELVRCYQESTDEAEREAAADQLLNEIYAPLKLFVYAHADKGNAEDVLQEILRDVFEKLLLVTGTTNESFWAWVYAIARRRCADSFRGRKVTLSTVADPELLQKALEQVSDDGESAAGRADLNAAIELLKASDYPCLGWLWNRYVIGLTFAELGRQEGVTEEAARKRVTRCLELARELMGV